MSAHLRTRESTRTIPGCLQYSKRTRVRSIRRLNFCFAARGTPPFYGLSIALALSVPAALGRSWILGATYLVVVFSIVIQGGSMDWILRRWNRKQAAA